MKGSKNAPKTPPPLLILKSIIKHWLIKFEFYEAVPLLMSNNEQFNNYIKTSLHHEFDEHGNIFISILDGHSDPTEFAKFYKEYIDDDETI
jgi:hypothetical protein